MGWRVVVTFQPYRVLASSCRVAVVFLMAVIELYPAFPTNDVGERSLVLGTGSAAQQTQQI